MWKKGSITVYMSLIILVIMAILAAAVFSARSAAGRAVLASGTEQGMYSLFAQYDRDLYQEYGLLFFDAGFDTEELQLQSLPKIVMEYARYITGEAEGKMLLRMSVSDGELLGYSLATDNRGEALRRQICSLMESRYGDLLAENEELCREKESIEAYEDTEVPSEDELRQVYEEIISRSEEKKAEENESEEDAGEYGPEYVDEEGDAIDAESLTDTEAGLPLDFINPLDGMENLFFVELIGTVISDPSSVSNYSVSSGQLPSQRSLNTGMGCWDAQEKAGAKILQLAYLMENFSCYTDGSAEEGLSYQLEYAIAGKNSDRENLETVLSRLMIIRETMNMAYLVSDSARCAEVEEIAALIGTLFMMPEAIDSIAWLLKGCWVYGESILDLRELLEGGKIAVMKSDSSWQSSVFQIPFIFLGESVEHFSSPEGGLSYSDYLHVLLLNLESEEMTEKIMDLTEDHLRTACGRSGFLIDCCVDAAEIKLYAVTGSGGITIVRKDGYANRYAG